MFWKLWANVLIWVYKHQSQLKCKLIICNSFFFKIKKLFFIFNLKVAAQSEYETILSIQIFEREIIFERDPAGIYAYTLSDIRLIPEIKIRIPGQHWLRPTLQLPADSGSWNLPLSLSLSQSYLYSAATGARLQEATFWWYAYAVHRCRCCATRRLRRKRDKASIFR